MSHATELLRLASAIDTLETRVAKEDGPDVGGMFKALAEVFESAHKEGVSEADAKEMMNAFEGLLKAVPKEVSKAARDAAAKASKGKKGATNRVANPLIFIAAAAAAKSASGHPPDIYGPSVGQMMEEEIVEAVKGVVKSVASLASKVGGGFKKAFGKLKEAGGKVVNHFSKDKGDSKEGPRSYKEYVEDAKKKGEQPKLDKKQWEARYGK